MELLVVKIFRGIKPAFFLDPILSERWKVVTAMGRALNDALERWVFRGDEGPGSFLITDNEDESERLREPA